MYVNVLPSLCLLPLLGMFLVKLFLYQSRAFEQIIFN